MWYSLLSFHSLNVLTIWSYFRLFFHHAKTLFINYRSYDNVALLHVTKLHLVQFVYLELKYN